MPLNITYEKSALASFLDEVPKLMLQYESAEADREYRKAEAEKERAYKVEETAKDRAWQESQTYITANLNELTRVRTEEDALRKEARDLGLTEVALKEISEEDITASSMEIVQGKEGRLLPAIQATDRIASAYDQNISAFNRGKSMAKALDTIPGSEGVVTLEELSKWIKSEQVTKGVGWQPTDAFMMGVTDYTFDPDRRIALQLAGIQKEQQAIILKYLGEQTLQDLAAGKISIEKVKAEISGMQLAEGQTKLQIEHQKIVNEYLPKQISQQFAKGELDIEQMEIQVAEAKLREAVLPDVLTDEASLRKIQIKTGYKSIEVMTAEIAYKQIQGSAAQVGIEATRKDMERVDQVIETTQFELDQKVRAEVEANVEKAIVDNTVYSADVGSAIFTNINFDDGEEVFNLSLVFDTMATDPAAGMEMLEESNFDEERFGLIRGDIHRLVGSVSRGKTEELVPDYTIFLKEVRDIKGLDDEYQNFITNNLGKIQQYQIDHRISPPETEPFISAEAIIGVAELDLEIDPINIRKAIQWRNTGIYDDMTALESAVDVIEQRDLLKSTRDTVRNLDIGYSFKGVTGLYAPVQGTAGAPPDTTGLDSSTIDQLFYNVMNPK